MSGSVEHCSIFVGFSFVQLANKFRRLKHLGAYTFNIFLFPELMLASKMKGSGDFVLPGEREMRHNSPTVSRTFKTLDN